MTKPDITRWADYVRGLAGPEAEKGMREHLAASPRARREEAAMRRVAEVAQADQALEVPEYAVRGAKAIGSLRRPETDNARSSIFSFLPFAVVFDSLSQPLPAGTRTLAVADRQLIFEAGNLTVDVRVEHEAGSRQTQPAATVLVGELLRTGSATDGGDTVEPLAEVPVLVRSGERIVGRAVTGRFGEFQAEDLPGEALHLCLLVARDQCLELPLG